MSRSERIAVAMTAAVSLILRAAAFFRYRFDSDEPQHLHVAWGWTAGLVQYRDVFDNHTPLFHILTAPILAAVGERSDVLFFMRAAMIPLFIVVIAGTYVLGSRIYSKRVGVWSAVILSLVPAFFLKSIEYRSDNLWNAIWIVALLMLLEDRGQRRSSTFAVGLLLGCALAVSIKTVVLLIALAVATIITGHVRPSVKSLAAFIAGFVIVPAAIAGYYVAIGAWNDLVYGVLGFNEGLTETRPHRWALWLAYPFAITAIVLRARRARNRDPRAVFLGVVTGVFLATLVAFWPLISPRDLLAILPLLVIFAVAAIDRSRFRVPALATLVVVLVLSVVYYANYLRNGTRIYTTAMNQALRLSRPGEPVMDHKGETIFRQRPFRFALEVVARESMQSGLIADTIPELVVNARCFVAQADGPLLPPRGRKFLSENFLDMGRYRAAGQWIMPDGSFTIAIPGPYLIVNDGGEARGSLDGQPYSGRVNLEAGAHRFDREIANQQLAVVWASAVERGFSPFHLQDRDF